MPFFLINCFIKLVTDVTQLALLYVHHLFIFYSINTSAELINNEDLLGLRSHQDKLGKIMNVKLIDGVKLRG